MLSINSVQANNQTPAFKGCKNILKAITEHKDMIKRFAKKPEKTVGAMEEIAGTTNAYKIANLAELKETVLKENVLGHHDFVRGLLSSNAAKNLYK